MEIIDFALSPVQEKVLKGILCGISRGQFAVLSGNPGTGKTTILRRIQAQQDACMLGMRQFVAALQAQPAGAIEEAFVEMIERAFAAHEVILVDDLHLVDDVTDRHYYPRRNLLNAALTALLDMAGPQHRVVFAVAGATPWPIFRRAYTWEIDDFTPQDYASISRTYLPAESAAAIDYTEVHRFSPKLNAHQLRKACLWLQKKPNLTTDAFVEHLRSHNLVSNVDLEEVRPVDWKDLKGADDVIRALEAKIALPFENSALTAQLDLKPKRGVLLAGPPGTGKTTIGRALAHRLKSKFFLIDGTVIAGSCDFQDEVDRIFEQAKSNAPSVVFIDDADVIFENSDQQGFYRYLLTVLDGLESASAERVCVILTAMDPSSLPAALVRSGRIELWLETRLPDEAAREVIFRERLSSLPHPLNTADTALLASASRGMTGADLKALIEDGKLSYADDVVRGAPVRPPEHYFLQAIDTIRSNGRRHRQRKSMRLAGSVRVGFPAEDE